MKKFAALIAIAAIVFPQSAIGQIYNSPHKWTDSSGKTRVYIPSAANTQIQFTSLAFRDSTVFYDRCGWATINLGSSVPVSISSSSHTLLPIAFTTAFAPTVCFIDSTTGNWNSREPGSNGVWVGGSVSTTSAGLSRAGYSYYDSRFSQLYVKFIYGNGSAGSGSIRLNYNRSFKLNSNACGFGTITVSTARPMATFKIGATNYTLATLPTVNNPQICRTQSGVKMKYVPLVP